MAMSGPVTTLRPRSAGTLPRATLLVGLACLASLTAGEATGDTTPRDPAPAPASALAPAPAPVPAAAPIARQLPKAIPAEAVQAEALKALKATYRADYAKRKPEEHLAFAKLLLTQGRVIGDSEGTRYVTLREGCEQAARAGDVALIGSGVEAVASIFAIDVPAEHLRLLLLVKEFTSAEAVLAVVDAELVIAGQGIDADDYPLAMKAAHAAEELARSAGDASVLANARSIMERAKLYGEEFAKLGEITDLLGAYTEEGSSRVGVFQCFVKNEWRSGLDHIVAGSDETYKALAAEELAAIAASPGAEAQLGIADRWWEVAQKQRGDAREGVIAHAFSWYRRAVNGLAANVRVRVEKRIEEIERLLSGSVRHPLTHYPPGAAILLSCERDTLVIQQDRLVGVLDISGHALHGVATGVKPVSGAFGGALSFDGTGHIDFGNPKVLQITGSMSIALWINPAALDARRNPFAKSYGGEGTMTLEPNGEVNYFYGTAGNNAEPYSSFASPVIAARSWTHLVLVRDLAAKRVLWYRNGKKGSDIAAPYPESAVSTLPLLIGSGYVKPFIGELDEFGVWPRALSEIEIHQLYDATAAGRH
jgi:hypothetical protein